jgi:murein DD-endopeptidase MepM/ murein hydrolase activator NlpD
MAERQAQTSMQSFAESLRSRRLSPVNPSAITGGRPIRLSGNIIAKKEIEELGQIRKTLGTLLAIEKRYYSFLGDRILNFAKEEQRRKSRERERLQEEGRGRSGKKSNANSIVEKAKSDISMIGEFFKNLLKFFVGYKVLQWASNPANSKKIQDFVTLFTKIFKFISAVTEFGVDLLMKTITVTSKVINGVFDFVGKVAEFFSFRWIGGGVEWLLKTIEDVTSVFASIPNAISLTVKFLTNLLPNFLESVLTNGLLGGQKELQGQAEQSVDTKKPVESPTETSAESDKTGQGDLGEKAKESLSNIGKNILKTLFPGIDIATNIGAKIGGSVKSLFTGSKSQEELPKLAKGGIVTKPTEAIIGEAGPEAILPLDKLGSFGIDGFKAATNKVIPKFMTLLTLPFKIIGAGILALISSTVGKIPGIGQFIKPLISNIASGFGLPPGLVSGMTGFVGGVGEMVTSGMGDVAELFGKKDININQQKGEDFNASRDTTVKGLLGNILGALISKQQKTAPATTPPGPPATPAPAPPATPAPAAPAGSPAAPSAAPAMSPIFDRSSTSGAVPGQGAGDKIPALLEPGEYVLNRNAVQGMGGPGVLDHINYNKFARFQGGGRVVTSIPFINRNIPGVSSGMHMGADIGANYEPLKSYIDGEVLETSPPSPAAGYGPKWIVWKGSDGRGHMFAHMSQIYVKKGDKLRKGQKIGISGNAGTGPHLHWEVSTNPGDVGQDKSSRRSRLNPLELFGKDAPFGGTIKPGEGNVDIAGKSESGAEPGSSTTAGSPTEFTAKMAASAAESLGKLFKMLNAPSANQELTSTPKPATPPKITQTVSQSSGNLQRVQKENLQLQSQSRNQSKTGGNVITLGQPNKTITQTTSQPMTAALGNTTPPNPLINYPIAP